ncbi:MAG: FYDLN acid domain-containing protein [Pseudomonadota bacterium]
MSKRAARGEKRKCQSEECDASFYDLNREKFDCPICGAEFDQDAHAAAQAELRNAAPAYARRKQPRELPIVAVTEASDTSSDENEAAELDEVTDGEEVGKDETAVAAAADVLLEEDEDTSDPLANAVPLAAADNEER